MSAENAPKLICVFVHGWGMNSAVWQSCLPLLPDWIDVIRVDLPGHGSMAAVGATGLGDYVQALAALVNRPVVWVGWSLGGLAVLKLAGLHPERVAGLFMVATNPCFVKRQGWQAGVDEAVFDAFADALERDVDATIKRFLALQVRGSKQSMHTVRELRQSLDSRGRADIDGLRLGLDILKHTDLREGVAALGKPVSWLLGERDTLVPAGLAGALEKLNPAIDTIIEPNAAHAPFISEPQHFAEALVKFADSLRTKQQEN